MIAHLVLDGVADGPLGVALDVVGTAARLARLAELGRVGVAHAPKRAHAGALEQRIVSLDGKAVRTGAGRMLAVDGSLEALVRGVGARAGSVLALPGLGAATERDVAALLERPDVVRAARLIARVRAKGALVAASCSATFVLGASGALDGGEATTTWWLGVPFARRFPRVALSTDRMVVESGGVMTAGSAFAHADLMLAIVARLAGPSLAHMAAKYLVLDERVSQSRYMVMEHLRASDPVVRALEVFVSSKIDRQVTLAQMARATATSPRTLARRVEAALSTTPRRFAQRLRIARAVHLLETTQQPIDEVAASVGYADAAAFRRVFRRETGESPGEARRARASASASARTVVAREAKLA